jgi:L-rhamnose mutarotase
MRRVGFKMKLFPGCDQEYVRRHDAIWPELISLLKETGISQYSIFLTRNLIRFLLTCLLPMNRHLMIYLRRP